MKLLQIEFFINKLSICHSLLQNSSKCNVSETEFDLVQILIRSWTHTKKLSINSTIFEKISEGKTMKALQINSLNGKMPKFGSHLQFRYNVWTYTRKVNRESTTVCVTHGLRPRRRDDYFRVTFDHFSSEHPFLGQQQKMAWA